MRRLAAAALLCLSLCVPARGGKLDLDIYAPPIEAPAREQARFDKARFFPGDPRALRGEDPWTRRLTHAGYAGLGLAGLIGSIASGGVAPAVGFGIVALVQGYLLVKSTRRRKST